VGTTLSLTGGNVLKRGETVGRRGIIAVEMEKTGSEKSFAEGSCVYAPFEIKTSGRRGGGEGASAT